MKKSMIIGVLLAVFSLFAWEYTPGPDSGLELRGGEERNQTLEYTSGRWKATVSPESRRELFFTFSEGKAPKFDEFTRGAFEWEFEIPPPLRLARVYIRIRDSKRQVLQYGTTVERLENGRYRVIADIDPEKPHKVRGVVSNGKINFPASIDMLDLWVRTGDGVVYPGKMTFRNTGGKTLQVGKVLHRFDEYDRWYGGKIYPCTEEGMRLESKQSELLRISERRGQILPLNRPESIVVDYDLERGAASLQIEMSARGEKTWLAPGVKLQPGRNSVVIPLAQLPEQLRKRAMLSRWRIQLEDDSVLVMKKVTAILKRTPSEAPEFDIETGNPVHFLNKGDEDKLRFVFKNFSQEPLALNAAIELRDFFGRRIEFKDKLSLAPNGEQKLAMPEKLPVFGWWSVSATLSEADAPEQSTRYTKTFLYAAPAGPHQYRNPNFTFGVGSHFGKWSDGEMRIEALAMALCGAKAVRSNQAWTSLEQKKGEYDFSPLDRKFAMVDPYDIKLGFLIGYTPKWAVKRPEELKKSKRYNNLAPDQEAWRNYVAAVVKRYGHRNYLWEVWNEPDLHGFWNGTVEEYLELLKIAHEEIKKIDPTIPVGTGGFATLKPERGPYPARFHERVLAEGKKYYDIHAYHEHGAFTVFEQMVDGKFLPMRKRAGVTVPWVANETSINSNCGYSKQAEILFQKMMFSWSRHAIGYFWYNVRDDGFDNYSEHRFGLLFNDFYPKPVYGVYNMLASVYKSAKFESDLSTPEFMCLRFSSEGDQLLALWTRGQAGMRKSYFATTDAKAAERIDIMGNRTPLTVCDGIVVIESGSTPETLQLKNSKQVKLLPEEPVKISFPGLCEEGKELRATLEAYNPLNRTITLKVEFNTPEKRSAEFKLASRSSQKFPLELPAGNLITAFYTIPETGWSGEISAPVPLLKVISSEKFDKRVPDFVLAEYKQVVEFFDNDPATVHMLWKGEKDLSGKVWLGLTDDALKIRVDIRDDVHIQPELRAEKIWNHDSIQVGITTSKGKTMEFGAALGPDNQTIKAFWSHSSLTNQLSAVVSRNADITRYELSLPLEIIEMSIEEMQEKGIGFNILINDDDGSARKCSMELEPGLGNEKDTSNYRKVRFKKAR